MTNKQTEEEKIDQEIEKKLQELEGLIKEKYSRAPRPAMQFIDSAEEFFADLESLRIKAKFIRRGINDLLGGGK